MKRLVLAAFLAVLATTSTAADVYTVDKSHSEVSFQVKHLMSQVRGRFSDFEGKIAVDAAKPEASSVEFTIKTASIDTNEPRRDDHLRSPDFFDAPTNPTISFKSTSMRKTGDTTYDVTGPFTMHGVTKAITLPVIVTGTAKDAGGNDRIGFEINTTLNRKEYGVVWNKALDAGGLLLGDDVKVSINLSTVKPKPQAAK